MRTPKLQFVSEGYVKKPLYEVESLPIFDKVDEQVNALILADGEPVREHVVEFEHESFVDGDVAQICVHHAIAFFHAFAVVGNIVEIFIIMIMITIMIMTMFVILILIADMPPNYRSNNNIIA